MYIGDGMELSESLTPRMIRPGSLTPRMIRGGNFTPP